METMNSNSHQTHYVPKISPSVYTHARPGLTHASHIASPKTRKTLTKTQAQDVCWWKQNMKWKWRRNQHSRGEGKQIIVSQKKKGSSSSFPLRLLLLRLYNPKWLHMSIRASPRKQSFDSKSIFIFGDEPSVFFFFLSMGTLSLHIDINIYRVCCVFSRLILCFFFRKKGDEQMFVGFSPEFSEWKVFGWVRVGCSRPDGGWCEC